MQHAGRTFQGTDWDVIACIIACGGTHSFAGFLVARIFQGVGACRFNRIPCSVLG